MIMLLMGYISQWVVSLYLILVKPKEYPVILISMHNYLALILILLGLAIRVEEVTTFCIGVAAIHIATTVLINWRIFTTTTKYKLNNYEKE